MMDIFEKIAKRIKCTNLIIFFLLIIFHITIIQHKEFAMQFFLTLKEKGMYCHSILQFIDMFSLNVVVFGLTLYLIIASIEHIKNFLKSDYEKNSRWWIFTELSLESVIIAFVVIKYVCLIFLNFELTAEDFFLYLIEQFQTYHLWSLICVPPFIFCLIIDNYIKK